MNEITQQKISIYEFPNSADEEENKMLKKLKVGLSWCGVYHPSSHMTAVVIGFGDWSVAPSHDARHLFTVA